jgi:hypothetical protein
VIFIFNIGLDIILKAIVLHKSFYSPLSASYQTIHLATVSIIEHVMFLIGFSFVFMISSQFRMNFISIFIKLNRKMYLSLVLPEYFKGVAIILQIFDQDPYLLTILQFLILSIQQVSFQTVVTTKITPVQIVIGLAVGTIFKILTRKIFFKLTDIITLGVIA